jgi:hypothetical protein
MIMSASSAAVSYRAVQGGLPAEYHRSSRAAMTKRQPASEKYNDDLFFRNSAPSMNMQYIAAPATSSHRSIGSLSKVLYPSLDYSR